MSPLLWFGERKCMKDGARAPTHTLGFLIEALAEVLRNKWAEGSHLGFFLWDKEITVLQVIRLILAFSIKVSKTKELREIQHDQ